MAARTIVSSGAQAAAHGRLQIRGVAKEPPGTLKRAADKVGVDVAPGHVASEGAREDALAVSVKVWWAEVAQDRGIGE